ncbi:hypothetical protein PLEOSDRAFT_1106465 [Pleurotus ostreatus PC15]|uniref:Uncharacterized protein n=1 Tax=Pleurotus ostreatus (strain PC15) TaxID=1137138 RepID=A0A067NPH8_PLEO1|nr:hypothetical protein PLEOSDRAFT_1106465 [Pleurotus ostreatus PC15]
MSANSPSGSSVNSERTRKQDADNKRGKETNEARARFKTLFPRAGTTLKSAEAAVLVCKHMKCERSVPRVADDVKGLGQLLKGEKAPTGASPEPKDENDDKEARQKRKKKEADRVRNEGWKRLTEELRQLFKQSATNLDAWQVGKYDRLSGRDQPNEPSPQLAYDFLVYGKERKVVPDLLNIPYKR